MLGCRSPRMGAPFQHTAARTGLVLCDTCVTASAVWLLAEWSAAGLAHGGALAGNPTEVLPVRSCSAPDHRRATPCQPPRRASAMLAGCRHGSSWRGSRGTAHGGLFSFRRLPHARTATVCPVCLAHKLSGADWLRGQVVSFPKAIPSWSWIVERLLWADQISALWPTGTPLARTPEEGLALDDLPAPVRAPRPLPALGEVIREHDQLGDRLAAGRLYRRPAALASMDGLDGWECPRVVEDLGARPVEPHGVVPAVHQAEAVGAPVGAAAEVHHH